jgi:pimeloyl-[acyl-carrier protein] synthase
MILTATKRVDLTAPELLDDPYPVYARLRGDPAIIYMSARPPNTRYAVLSRYADVQRALRHPAFGRRNVADLLRRNLGDGPLAESMARWMVFRDPPDHTRLRNLVMRAFTPKAVERLTDTIDQLVEYLLEPLSVRSEFDLMSEFAYPLPVLVICILLGVPSPDRAQFRAWSADIARILDLGAEADPENVRNGNAAVKAVTDYFQELIAERRSVPADDLLSALAATDEDGDRLTDAELLANCVLMFFAGHETTVNLIGNGVLALLRHPDQLERLREYPLMAAQAVEELLRFDSPLQRTGRGVLEDVELADGQVIEAGTRVSLLIGAANRDPLAFEQPDQLQLERRTAHRHLAFGAGIHYCVGAPLARLEAQIAIPGLLRRLPHLRLLDQTPRWRPTFTVRALEALHVAP